MVVSRIILFVMVQQRICLTAHALRAHFARSIEADILCSFGSGQNVISGALSFVTALTHEALIKCKASTATKRKILTSCQHHRQ